MTQITQNPVFSRIVHRVIAIIASLFCVSILLATCATLSVAQTNSLTENEDILYNECVVMGNEEDILPLGYSSQYNRTYNEKVINCVVHVLHDNQYFPHSNIGLEIIEEALDQLNVDFDSTNISFNLVNTTYTHLGTFAWADSYRGGSGVCFPQYGTQMAQWTDMVRWNTAEYCNIYVAPDFCSSILGFAWVLYQPWSDLDGVWVETEVFGLSGPHLTFRYENETLTHEMGHYCGLHHVFRNGSGTVSNCGQNLGDCEFTGDYVCDTPPTKVSYGCPGIPGYYCPASNYNNVSFAADNHMDYSHELCRDKFTPGQIERMHAMLEYQRSELFSDDVFCFGDLDNDCHVGTSDLLVILSNYNCEGCTVGDLDLNYIVNSSDLLYLLSVYGQTCDCGFVMTPIQHMRKPEDIHELLEYLNNH
jgi:hypothetical protein